MKTLILVACGGACGAVARWAMAGGIDRLAGGAKFPWGTVLVNLAGCFLIGMLYGLAEGRSWLTESVRALLAVGFLGGFTTFSAYGWQSFELLRHGHAAVAFANLIASATLGLLCVWCGYAVGR